MPTAQVRSLTPTLGRYRHDPVAYFSSVAHSSVEDVLLFGLGPAVVAVCNSPRAVEELLVTKAGDFEKASGTSNAAIPWARRFFGSGLLVAEGTQWARARQRVQPAFHADRLRTYEAVIDEAAHDMTRDWPDGGERDVYGDALVASLAMLAKTLILGLTAQEQTFLLGALARVFELQRPGRGRVPFPPWVPTPRNRSTAALARELDELVYGLIRQRRAAPQRGDDVVGLLLAARGADGEPISDSAARDELMTMLLAAHDPTASAIARTLQLLAEHPDTQRRLRDELDAARLGSDRAASPYLRAVVDESLRLYPPGRGISRKARQATTLVGTPLPAGAVVLAHQRVVQRHPRLFEAPHEFRPERWLDPAVRGLAHGAFFPFGVGPRTCVGHAFALLEIRHTMSRVLQEFVVRARNAETSIWDAASMRPVDGVRLIVSRQRRQE